MNKADYIGFAAALCSSLAILPQAIKIYRNKSAKDVSLVMYIISSIGIILWFIHGIFINSYPLILSNLFSLTLTLSIVIMKLKWKK